MGYHVPQVIRSHIDGFNCVIKRVDSDMPYIFFNSVGRMTLAVGSSDYIALTSGAYQIAKLTGASGTSTIEGGGITGDNLHLKANAVDANPIFTLLGGTDKIKFGAYSAGAASDSTGYILIEDKDGNERKLMVQA